MNDPSSDQSGLQALLVPVAEDGENGKLLTHGRIKDVAAARQIYQRLKTEDRLSAYNRMAIQGELEGVPPYDDAELRSAGLGDMTNINMGFALMFYDQAKAPYHDLTDSVDTFCTLPTTYGTEAERTEWCPIMEVEWATMLRSWPDFSFRFNDLVGKYVYHGVGMCLFPNSRDLRWEASALGDVLLPRRTKATEGDIEVMCWLDHMPPHRLYLSMEEAKVSKNRDWHREACMRALRGATPQQASTTTGDIEQWLDAWKNNDLGSASGAAEIKAVHMLVRELDGKISHYIFTEEGELTDDWLYIALAKYTHLNNAAVMFTYGTGTNGFYYSIRGMGQRIFDACQALNRMWCAFIDSTMNSMKEIVQADSEADMQDIEITQYGNLTVIPPGLKFEPRQIPNYAQAILPSMQTLQTSIGQKTSIYASEATFNDSKERTRSEVLAHLDSLSKLSVSTLNLFYEPWERTLREQVRRSIRKDVTAACPFGEQILAWRNRCMKKGVPIEAIYNIDLPAIRAVRAVGQGSAAARSVAFERLMAMYDKYDTTGQKNLLRLITRAIAGNQITDVLARPPDEERVDNEQRIAQDQNYSIEQGFPVPVNDDDTHIYYVEARLGRLAFYNEQLDSGQMGVQQGIPPMIYLHANAQKHLEYIPTDAKAPEYRKILQQLGETMNNGLKKLRAEQEQEEKQAMEQGGAPGAPAQGQNGDTPATLQRQLVESQLLLQQGGFKAEAHQMDMLKKSEEIKTLQQKRALADAKTAADIAAKGAR